MLLAFIIQGVLFMMAWKKKLKKYAYESSIISVENKQFILDYDSCGVDEKLHMNIQLFENLVKKHFAVTYIEVLPGMRILYYI